MGKKIEEEDGRLLRREEENRIKESDEEKDGGAGLKRVDGDKKIKEKQRKHERGGKSMSQTKINVRNC